LPWYPLKIKNGDMSVAVCSVVVQAASAGPVRAENSRMASVNKKWNIVDRSLIVNETGSGDRQEKRWFLSIIMLYSTKYTGR
jgi:hypothetical protein